MKIKSIKKEQYEEHLGTNPCSEIILRDKQFCNLTEVVVRSNDTIESLKRKIELATILGTIQSTFTNFNFLSEDWKKNTEEERLLGVSLTGIMDNSLLNGNTEGLHKCLEELRNHARQTNHKWAEIFGIQPSAAITCVKPSGTVSQLVDSSSGIHARHSSYYIRTIRLDIKDPITQFLVEQGVPNEPDHTKPESTVIFSFPQQAPNGAITRNDRSALEQLELWLIYQRHWCEHKPSITVYVKESEWLEVGAWVYKHFDEVSGIAFLPHSGGTYRQAPYQEITKEQYEEFPKTTINWELFVESDDFTTGVQELACTGGNCEI
jgi:ribonucleoside-diphosphate reductase alpha chain